MTQPLDSTRVGSNSLPPPQGCLELSPLFGYVSWIVARLFPTKPRPSIVFSTLPENLMMPDRVINERRPDSPVNPWFSVKEMHGGGNIGGGVERTRGRQGVTLGLYLALQNKFLAISLEDSISWKFPINFPQFLWEFPFEISTGNFLATLMCARVLSLTPLYPFVHPGIWPLHLLSRRQFGPSETRAELAAAKLGMVRSTVYC